MKETKLKKLNYLVTFINLVLALHVVFIISKQVVPWITIS